MSEILQLRLKEKILVREYLKMKNKRKNIEHFFFLSIFLLSSILIISINL